MSHNTAMIYVPSGYITLLMDSIGEYIFNYPMTLDSAIVAVFETMYLKRADGIMVIDNLVDNWDMDIQVDSCVIDEILHIADACLPLYEYIFNDWLPCGYIEAVDVSKGHIKVVAIQ